MRDRAKIFVDRYLIVIIFCVDKFLRVPFWLRIAWIYFFEIIHTCGFINANEWIFDMERPQKREKTNEIDTFQLRKVKIVNQKKIMRGFIFTNLT